jgi:2-polyprenyl-3-methyl-5-hydroxy-6-metoxy-1,4-benzoquinol methylase
MVTTCPLCRGSDVSAQDHISKEQLQRLYLKEYQIDINIDVPTDMTLFHCAACDLKFFNPCYTGSQSFYEGLQKFDWYYQDNKYEYRYVLPWFSHNDEVLEIGCGKGAFSSLLNTTNYTGIEFSKNAARIGRTLGRKIVAQTAEYHAKKNPEKYDVVCSFQVLEHVTDPRSFIAAAVKALKPGGTLILTMPSEDSFLGEIQDFALNMPPHHVTRWSDKCLNIVAAEFGLECVHLHHEPLDPYHYRWCFTSKVVHQIHSSLGVKHRLLKQPLHRLTHAVALALFKVFGNRVSKEMGHTVVAIYKKSMT